MKFVLICIFALGSISAALLLNIYSSLNITEDEAKEQLVKSIVEGRIVRNVGPEDLVTNARQLSDQERAEGMKQLMKMAKEYTATEDFKKAYKKARNEQLNGSTKTKLGLPKIGKIIDKKIDNTLDKSENEKKYPAEASDMVKKRLKDFLDISATVDFDAVVESGRFVNPEYERKSGWWKMCYRAGKPVIDVAREEAKKWLDEMNEN